MEAEATCTKSIFPALQAARVRMGRLFLSYGPVIHSQKFLLLAAVAIVSASVLMPPVCDLLFKCGCSWLWTTAAAHCNVHNAAPPHCPWCSHGAAGYYLPYVGFIAGQFLAGALVFRLTGQLILAVVSTVAGDIARWIPDGSCHSPASQLSALDFLVATSQTSEKPTGPSSIPGQD